MMHNSFFAQGKNDVDDLVTDIGLSMYDLISINDRAGTLNNIFNMLDKLNLKLVEKRERIFLIDSAIKVGSIELVEMLAEKFIALGFADDIRVPFEGHGEHPYRPVFWLAAVCTRLPNIPVENFSKIEKYLCEKFQIPNSVVIGDTAMTRDQYVDAVTVWKSKENIRLKNRGRSDDRYI